MCSMYDTCWILAYSQTVQVNHKDCVEAETISNYFYIPPTWLMKFSPSVFMLMYLHKITTY